MDTVNDIVNLTYEGPEMEQQEYKWRTVTTFSVTTFFLCMALGLPANLLLLFSVIKHPQMHQAPNIFLANISCVNLLLIVLVLPFRIIAELNYNWSGGLFTCRLVPYIHLMCLICAVLNYIIIPTERLFKLFMVKKIVYWFSKMKINMLVCCLLWVLSFVLAAPLIPNWIYEEIQMSNYESRVCLQKFPSSKHSDIYVWLKFSLCFITPVVIILLLYIVNLCKIHSSSRNDTEIHEIKDDEKPGLTLQETALKNGSEIRTLVMLIVVTAVFFLFWICLTAGEILFMQVNKAIPPEEVVRMFYIFETAAMLQIIPFYNMWMNPALCAIISPQFREAMKATLMCRKM